MGVFSELAIYPRLLTRILPAVERELTEWTAAARVIPDKDLRAQALASLDKKKFHCVGGAVLALLGQIDGTRRPARGIVRDLIRSIVAIQTMSDYLDNLCDRSLVATRLAMNGRHGQDPPRMGVHDAYLRLHDSMLCAVDPKRPPSDYYREYSGLPGGRSHLSDGGYLDRLAEASRGTLRELPGYGAAKPWVIRLVRLYSELQAGKHMPADVRDGIMERWFKRHRSDLARPIRDQASAAAAWLGRDLRWWEFAAATGSTLAIFALIAASAREAFSSLEAGSLVGAYFPAVCGLHILLDYFIDQGEDVGGGDLNFVARYSSPEEATGTLERFVRWALHGAARCSPAPHLHVAVVRGLLAMYLSDPKVEDQGLREQAFRLSRAGGGSTPLLRSVCSRARGLLGF